MGAFRVTLARRQRRERAGQLHTAQHRGTLHDVTCLLAMLAVPEGQSGDDVARTLRVTRKSVHPWVRRLRVEGLTGLHGKKPTGRFW
jgi:transposase